MNKNYLPFYNRLNDKEKTFWLDLTKEELIDHLIANINNGEKLLNRIDKAIEYMNSLEFLELMNSANKEDYFKAKNKLLDILGDGNNE